MIFFACLLETHALISSLVSSCGPACGNETPHLLFDGAIHHYRPLIAGPEVVAQNLLQACYSAQKIAMASG
jgi:hypothetical protein